MSTNLFLNGEDVRHLQGLDTELAEEDKLRIIPSIAGGISKQETGPNYY
jgi:molybdopterin synthase sulfur carrier subunit